MATFIDRLRAFASLPPANSPAKGNIDVRRPDQKSKRPGPGAPLSVEGESWILDVTSGIASSISPNKGGVRLLPTDEVIRRAGSYRVYKDMLTDDMVKLCLNLKKILVAGRTWDIKPADESEQAKEIAKFVECALMDVNLPEIFREALSALEFGFCAGEIVWKTKMLDDTIRLALDTVKFRDPQYIEIHSDNHGNIDFFRQTSYGNLIDLPAKDVFHYAHQSQFGNPYGVSDLRAAYRGWWAKKFIVNFWNVYLERLGSPITMMKYPKGASQQLKDALKEILEGLSSKGEVLVPEGVVAELLEAKRAGTPTYGEALHFHNNSIAHATLMVGMIGADTESARSADSQSRIHLRSTFKMADEVAKQLVFVLEQKIIKPMVDYNFNVTNLYPKFIFQDYGEYDATLIADAIRQLFVGGMIDPDQADLNYVRSILGLPIRGEDDAQEEVVRPAPTPPPGGNTTPPAAPQGNERGGTANKGARKTDPNASRNK